MIKVTYETHEEKAKKPELTEVNIFKGRYFIKYNVPNKAKMIVDQMNKDGRKGVLYSRGVLIQIFKNKDEEEILEIVKKDIDNGVFIAEQKTKRKIEIKNLRIERK
jgi:hypothetical protein